MSLSRLSRISQRIPRWITAELTYRCPLSCFYCSNPTQMSTKNELTTAQWIDVFRQGREMGFVQLGFTGGEPLMRPDLLTLVKEARDMGYYTNLITSAMGLTEKKIDKLKDAGIDSIQISFQAENKDLNAFIGGKDSYDQKLKMMKAVTSRNIPLTLNVVIHRLNIDRMMDICRLCDSMSPDHVEIASMQCHGWAFKNASVLMPTPEQVKKAQEEIELYQSQSNASGVYYVLPDLIEKRAKNCQQGWGNTYVCINPQGDVTPCLSAHTLPSINKTIPNIKNRRLKDIWNGSVFTKYAGLEWMTEDARSHPRRDSDGGGCRCQAYLLTGSETAMDPVDDTAIHHSKFVNWVEEQYSSPTILKKLYPRKC